MKAETVRKSDLLVVKRFGEPIYPALVPVDRVTCTSGKPYHTLINAENFHALQLLLYCYEASVDVFSRPSYDLDHEIVAQVVIAVTHRTSPLDCTTSEIVYVLDELVPEVESVIDEVVAQL